MTTQYNIPRNNMINYIRTWDVSDSAVLNIMGNTSREFFFPKNISSLSYADAMIPIGYGQVSLEPKMIARILQSLNLKKSHSVLEIGTGSGYLTTLLSQLTKEVHTIELIPEISNKATNIFKTLNINNIFSKIGNGMNGWDALKTFDIIIITGSLNQIPANLLEKLNNNGKMFATIGIKPVMRAKTFSKIDNKISEEVLFDTNIPELKDTNI